VLCERRVPRALGRLFLFATYSQFERDVPIWSNKVFLPRPVLVKEDAVLKEFRRWCGLERLSSRGGSPF
jgi:hypothetical protein